jgi:hypothetical protein
MRLQAANDNFKPTKLLSFAELTTTRGITFNHQRLSLASRRPGKPDAQSIYPGSSNQSECLPIIGTVAIERRVQCAERGQGHLLSQSRSADGI